MKPKMKPRWVNKVPMCVYDCPCVRFFTNEAVDCSMGVGLVDIGICLPMVRKMREALWQLERSADGRGALWETRWFE